MVERGEFAGCLEAGGNGLAEAEVREAGRERTSFCPGGGRVMGSGEGLAFVMRNRHFLVGWQRRATAHRFWILI